MPSQLHRELKQEKPWALQDEAYLNLQRSAEVLLDSLSVLLKPYQLTAPQYNVLRILRGAGPKGLACGQIGERMLNRDPDVTRLADRLETTGLVSRSRDSQDRRVITIRITKLALELLDRLDEPVRELHRRQFQKLSNPQLVTLIELLESSR